MILVATPTRDTVIGGYVGDLVKLLRRHLDARFYMPLGIYVGNLRQSCVMAAQQIGASHVLFIDSDMRFPVDALEQLLLRDENIIAANYVQRTAPQWWTARRGGEWVSSVGRTGTQRVDFCGMGLMLIRRTVFDLLERPWFDTPYDGENHVGEDRYFCEKARKAGLSVWIDHDLSQHVRHQGTVELGA